MSNPEVIKTDTAKTVTVRLVKGMRGCRERHRQSVRALGALAGL